MKTNKLSVLLLACLFILSGCRKQTQTITAENTTVPSTIPTATVVPAEVTEPTSADKLYFPEETVATFPTEMQSTTATEPSSKPQATEPKSAPTTSTAPAAPKKPTSPATPTVSEEITEPTRPAASPESSETQHAPTEPTIPESSTTEPPTTEPTGCAHDWVRIHHDEKGHWKAGVVCDCGWTLYGKSDEVASKWNAHSASYPPEESFLNHGGYGSVDEWIVDKPAYDEWVCCHCGEPKP